jgi:alpha-beta hydrolase superfamily lysophospholipase
MSTSPVHSDQTIASSDGTELYVQKWTSSEPKAELVILHGYLEHSGRYREFSEYLCEKGHINITTWDFRGHGKSGGVKAFCRSFADYHADLDTVLQTIPKNTNNNTTTDSNNSPKVFVLGHSNGGLTTLDYIRVHSLENKLPVPIQGWIVTSPFLAPAEALPFVSVLASKVLGNWFPTLSMKAELPTAHLTSDPEKQKAAADDPLMLKQFTVGWALQSMKTMKKVQAVKVLDPSVVPALLFVYSGKDKVASPSMNQKISEQLECQDKTVICREEEEHEMLNEVKRTETYDIIQEWILKRCA